MGTPSQVADGLETWVNEADIDGFNFVSASLKPNITDLIANRLVNSQAYTLFPQSFKDIVELLLPELKKRGLFWDDYAVPAGTYRENFYRNPGQSGPPPEHVASTFRWKAGVSAEEAVIPEI